MLDVLSTKRTARHRPTALPRVLLAVALAFPLGILTALTSAIRIFATILPISIFLGLVLPIAVPLVVLGGTALAIRLLALAIARILIDAAVHIAVRTKSATAMAIYILDVAYMGLYGVLVLVCSDPPTARAETSLRRASRPRLFIKNMPRHASFACLPTPPWSSPSYTPSRSPTFTEDTDTSLLPTPVDEPSFSRMSDILHALDQEELDVVASYVAILRKGREE